MVRPIADVVGRIRYRLFAIPLLVLSGWLAHPAAWDATGGEKADRDSKRDLKRETFAEVHARVRPHEREWRHLEVEWLTDVVAARRRAADEDKPIVICYTGGAGYNEPLGVC